MEMRTLRKVVLESATSSRSTTVLFAIFALLALLLGTVGVHGVLSYSVAERTQEIGVRMALGAQKRIILKMVVVQGLRLTIAGVAIRVVAALTRFLSNLLYGVKATDALTFVAVSLILVTVALVASYIPPAARRRWTRWWPYVTNDRFLQICRREHERLWSWVLRGQGTTAGNSRHSQPVFRIAKE